MTPLARYRPFGLLSVVMARKVSTKAPGVVAGISRPVVCRVEGKRGLWTRGVDQMPHDNLPPTAAPGHGASG